MSTEIENRIVEMTFDNKDFEKGVAQTIKSLESLERSLKLEGAPDGLERLSTAVNAMNYHQLDEMSSSLDKVTDKFTLLGQIGYQAMERVASKVVDVGTNMIKSLTVDQVSAGLAKFERQNVALAALMAALPEKTESEIKAYLEQLQTYTDETSYDYAGMIEIMQKMVNQGVNADDALAAIKGVGNEAALAGANIQQGMSAMNAFTKSLSRGYVMINEWDQVGTATADTKEFKEQLIQTAIAMGQLDKNGAYSKVVGSGKNKQIKKTIVNFENFRDTLRDGWLTTDVLLKTLSLYSDTTTEFGKKAFRAAQEAITLSQALDAVKDAASTGWMQSYQAIFGDLKSSTSMFTDLANSMIAIVQGNAEMRNNWLNRWRKVMSDEISELMGMEVDGSWFYTVLKDAKGNYILDENGEKITIGALVNIMNVAEQVAQAVREAFAMVIWPFGNDSSDVHSLGEIFGLTPETREQYGLTSKSLANATKSFFEFTAAFQAWLTTSRDGNESHTPLNRFRSALAGVLSVVGLAVQLFTSFATTVGDLFMRFEPFIAAIIDFAGKVGDLLYDIYVDFVGLNTIPRFFQAIEDEIGPVIDVVATLAGSFLDLISALLGLDDVESKTSQDKRLEAIRALSDFLVSLPHKLTHPIETITELIGSITAWASNPENKAKLEETKKALKEWFDKNISGWIEKGKEKLKNLPTEFSQKFEELKTVAKNFFYEFLKPDDWDDSKGFGENMMAQLNKIWVSIQDWFTRLPDKMKTLMPYLEKSINEFFKPEGWDEFNGEGTYQWPVLKALKDFFANVTSVWNNIKNFWDNEAKPWIDATFGPTIEKIKNFGSMIWNAIKGFFEMDVSSENGFAEKLQKRLSAFDPVIKWVNDKFGKLLDLLGIGSKTESAIESAQAKTNQNGSPGIFDIISSVFGSLFGISSASAEEFPSEVEKKENTTEKTVSVAERAGNFISGAFKSLGEVLKSITGGMRLLWVGLTIHGIGSIVKSLTGLTAGNALANIALIIGNVASLVIDIGVALTLLTASYALAPKAFTQGFTALTNILGAIGSVILILAMVTLIPGVNMKAVASAFSAVAMVIGGIVGSIFSIVISIAILKGMSDFEIGFLRFAAILGALTLVAGAVILAEGAAARIAKGNKKFETAVGKTLVGMAVAILAATYVIKKLAALSENEWITGTQRLIDIGLCILIAEAAFLMIKNVFGGKSNGISEKLSDKLKAFADVIKSIAIAMAILLAGVFMFASLDLRQAIQGVVGMGLTAAILLGLMAGSTKILKAAEDLEKGDFSKIPPILMAVFGSAAILVATMLGLVAVFSLLPTDTDWTTLAVFLAGAAVIFYVLGAVAQKMAVAMEIIGKLNLTTMLKGFVGLMLIVGVLFTALAGMIALLDSANTVIWKIGNTIGDFSEFIAKCNWENMKSAVSWYSETIGTFKDNALKPSERTDIIQTAGMLNRVATNMQLFSTSAGKINWELAGQLKTGYSDIVKSIVQAQNDLNSVEGLDMEQMNTNIAQLGAAVELYYMSLGKTVSQEGEEEIIAENPINGERLGKIFEEIAKNLPSNENLLAVGYFAEDAEGGTNLTNFSLGIVNMGNALSSYAASLEDFNDGEFTKSADFLQRIKDLGGGLPTELSFYTPFGYVSAKWLTLSDFANDVVLLGDALGSFCGALSGEDSNGNKYDSTLVEAGIKNLESFKALQNALKGTSFKFQALIDLDDLSAGYSLEYNKAEDLGSWGQSVSELGAGLAAFATKINAASYDDDKIGSALLIADKMKDIQNGLTGDAGLLSWFSRTQNLGDFASNMKSFGTGIASFATSTKDIETSGAWNALVLANKLAALNERIQELDTNQLIALGNAASHMWSGATGIDDIYKGGLKDVATEGASEQINALVKPLLDTFDAAVIEIRNKYQDFYDAGYYLGTGLGLGMADTVKSIESIGKAMGEASVTGVNEGAGVASPSWKTFISGGFTGEGFNLGIEAWKSTVGQTAQDLGNSAVDNITETASHIEGPVSDMFKSMTDNLPTFDTENLGEIKTAVTGALGDAWDEVKGSAEPIIGKIKAGDFEGALTDLNNFDPLGTAGQSLLDNAFKSIMINPVNTDGLDLTDWENLIPSGNLLGGLSQATQAVSAASASHKAMIRQADTMGQMLNTMLNLRDSMIDMTDRVTNLKVVMDTGVTVGQLAPSMDRFLGTSMN